MLSLFTQGVESYNIPHRPPESRSLYTTCVKYEQSCSPTPYWPINTQSKPPSTQPTNARASLILKMCIHIQIILYCPHCPNTDTPGSELQKCTSMPKNKVSCHDRTTRYAHRESLCQSCTLAEPAEVYQLKLLTERLELRIRYLEQTVGFPAPSEAAWEGFWKGLDAEARGLFVEVWSLQGEVGWRDEELMMREG